MLLLRQERHAKLSPYSTPFAVLLQHDDKRTLTGSPSSGGPVGEVFRFGHEAR